MPPHTGPHGFERRTCVRGDFQFQPGADSSLSVQETAEGRRWKLDGTKHNAYRWAPMSLSDKKTYIIGLILLFVEMTIESKIRLKYDS